MEEGLFRATYRNLKERECWFEKGILRGCCSCPCAERLHLAERIGIGCRDEQANRGCRALLDGLLANARFALRLPNGGGPLPHGKRIKLECGGLAGLRQLLEQGGDGAVEDVAGLVQEALSRFDGLNELPYQRLMPAIAAFQSRPARKR